MADTAAPVKQAKKKVTKPKAPAAHPKYADMVKAAISAQKERSGSSRSAILKYILANYKVGPESNKVNAHLKLALKAGVKSGALKQVKGVGASGSFKLGEKAEKKPKAKKVTKPKAAAAKKPKAKKPKAAAKKTGEKKVATKKPKAAKKPAAKKPAAKPKKAKSPKKAKTAKPKVKKSPKKKAAAKKA